MNSCLGPCLLHCYYTNSIALVFIGIFLGIILSHYKYFITFDKNANNLFE